MEDQAAKLQVLGLPAPSIFTPTVTVRLLGIFQRELHDPFRACGVYVDPLSSVIGW
jgi:hypothetical protein